MLADLYDAHIHLAASSLAASIDQISESYTAISLSKAVVVGTSPNDWPDVLALTSGNERFIPAIGLHPWQVNDAPGDWQNQFLFYLEKGVRVIGEIGLDQWIEGYDIERQKEAFIWQMALAAERNLPTSIHCLKAHEPMLQTLRAIRLPERGFKLHAYGGPIETLKPLLDLGAHFSFNAGQLKPNATRICELIRLIPDNRILIETDAPDFLPPPELSEFELNGSDRCHPANLRIGYQAIANLRGVQTETLAKVVSENFNRYFR